MPPTASTLLGKRPANLRLNLDLSRSQSNDDSTTNSGSSSGGPSSSTSASEEAAQADPSRKRLKKTKFSVRFSNQPGGCLTPTDSAPLLANSLKLASEGTPEDDSSAVGNYSLLTPLDSSGKCHHALDKRTGEFKICQVLNQKEYAHLLKLTERLQSVSSADWPYLDAAEMSDCVVPTSSEIVRHRDGRIYYFTEKHAGSLHSHVQQEKKLEEREAKALYAQVVRIVAFCHSIGIIVRDLKLRKFVFADEDKTMLRLGNISDTVVLGEAGEDWLTDRHGCPAYVSPEILNLSEKRYSGRAADVWSLGVLLFVMLMGRYPFYDNTPAGLFGKIRQGTFQLPSDEAISGEARVALRGILRRNPRERPTARALLAVPWLQSGGASERVRAGVEARERRKALLRDQRLADQLVPALPEDLPTEAPAATARRRPPELADAVPSL